jgi:hypothetical protein
VKGETPTATGSDNSPLVCNAVDVRMMMAEMQNVFMMPVGIDWQDLLGSRSYDQSSR